MTVVVSSVYNANSIGPKGLVRLEIEVVVRFFWTLCISVCAAEARRRSTQDVLFNPPMIPCRYDFWLHSDCLAGKLIV
jgi:hypothetical protein